MRSFLASPFRPIISHGKFVLALAVLSGNRCYFLLNFKGKKLRPRLAFKEQSKDLLLNALGILKFSTKTLIG